MQLRVYMLAVWPPVLTSSLRTPPPTHIRCIAGDRLQPHTLVSINRGVYFDSNRGERL